jgi:hypothetical protein
VIITNAGTTSCNIKVFLNGYKVIDYNDTTARDVSGG